MFYSHEILTSRKYGIATVWLVATLGQKSTLRKVTRKAILRVDVQKACETILAPEAPMALRLQSNLLYGVTRVYSQQAGYVLADAQSAQNSLRMLFKTVRRAELDQEAGKARPDQLVIEDDPTFLLDHTFALLDDDILGKDIGLTTDTQLSAESSLSRTTASHQSQLILSPGGLLLPTSDTGDMGGFMQQSGGSSNRPRPSSQLAREVDTLLEEAGFDFNEDGVMQEHHPGVETHQAGPRFFSTSDAVASARVRQEHNTGSQADVDANNAGQDLDMAIGHDYDMQLESGPFSDGYHPQPARSSEALYSSSIAAAPLRRKARVPKPIPIDTNTELRNRDLMAMNNNYLTAMVQQRDTNFAKKTTKQIKDSALHWILGIGINRVGDGIGRSKGKTPLLDMFSGASLFHLVTGKTLEVHGQKRESEGDETGDAERRVRARLDAGDQVGRGAAGELGDDGYYLQGDDVEMGRDAPDDHEDISSAMPWNVSASIRGSSIARGLHGSVTGPPGSVTGSVGRPGSRMISASPLLGRGRLSGLEQLAANEGLTSEAYLVDELGGIEELGDYDEFQLYGPGTEADTQEAGHASWQKRILDRESDNFLDFIRNSIEGRRMRLVDGDVDTIDFEDILPPNTNSRVVAAQALLHVLTLTTKNLIATKQREDFGPIQLRLVNPI